MKAKSFLIPYLHYNREPKCKDFQYQEFRLGSAILLFLARYKIKEWHHGIPLYLLGIIIVIFCVVAQYLTRFTIKMRADYCNYNLWA